MRWRAANGCGPDAGPTTEEEFFFRLPFATMDLLWYAENHGVAAEEAADVMGLTVTQVERAFREFAQRRRTTAYLRSSSADVRRAGLLFIGRPSPVVLGSCPRCAGGRPMGAGPTPGRRRRRSSSSDSPSPRWTCSGTPRTTASPPRRRPM